MTLIDLKNYLMRVKMASLSSICSYFNSDPEASRQMLNIWIRKGCIRQCLKTPNCGTKCGKCSPLITEIYEWCF